MKKNLLISTIFFLLTVVLNQTIAQGTWIKKADIPISPVFKTYAASFTIGNKGYVGTGFDGNNTTSDFWEYNPSNNTWTQLANVPGNPRKWGIGFSIGNKGYIGLGSLGSNLYNDFYEYDPSANLWTQKANFTGATREEGTGFSVNGKGYVAFGYDSFYSHLSECWEYDPSNNSWNQKANLPASGRRDAIAFTIGNYAYAGAGYNAGSLVDFWQFDPVANSWTQKANCPSGGYYCAAFAIDTFGYLYTGANPPSNFYRYNPATNFWQLKPAFPGNSRPYARGLNIDKLGYIVAGGSSSPGIYFRDCWQYCDTCFALSVSVSSTNSVVCSGNCATLTASASGGAPPYNFLWNPSGQTSQSIVVCPSSTTSYTATVTDANSTTATSISSVTVNSNPVASISGNTTINSGNSTTLTATGGGTYSWYPSTGLSSTTGSTVVATPTSTITYCVIATVGNCSDTSCVTVNVLPTGIQDLYSNKSLSIFPNPFSSQTVLQTDNILHNATLTVDNCFGQTVAQIKNINGQTVVFSRDNLASGLYFVRLIQDNKVIAIDKLVIADR